MIKPVSLNAAHTESCPAITYPSRSRSAVPAIIINPKSATVAAHVTATLRRMWRWRIPMERDVGCGRLVA